MTARATGIEPATTGSTVRYSNQLSYAPKSFATKHLRLLGRAEISRWSLEPSLEAIRELSL